MKMLLISVLAGILAFAATLQSAELNALHQAQTIPLPGVEGRFDHFGVDVQGQRLFVSALGNNTLEVIDLRHGKRLTSIMGLREPQGVFFVLKKTSSSSPTARMGHAGFLTPTPTNCLLPLILGNDADNVRYDARPKQIYVGYGTGALGILAATTGRKIGEISLRAHPESFQLEGSGQRIFVNMPDANHTIAVVDRTKRSVITTWPVEAQANFPMALDEVDHRLFVVTRKPPTLVVLDTESGKQVASYPAVGDADDVFYDAVRKRVYISGGEGFLDVFTQSNPDHYQPAGRIPTASGARTSLFVPDLNRLYLAVPHRGNQKAEIRVYEITP